MKKVIVEHAPDASAVYLSLDSGEGIEDTIEILVDENNIDSLWEEIGLWARNHGAEVIVDEESDPSEIRVDEISKRIGRMKNIKEALKTVKELIKAAEKKIAEKEFSKFQQSRKQVDDLSSYFKDGGIEEGSGFVYSLNGEEFWIEDHNGEYWTASIEEEDFQSPVLAKIEWWLYNQVKDMVG